jgi:Na+-exporting ATPase
MSTAWKYVSEQETTDDMLIFMKGAVERILDRCTHIGLNPDNQIELTEKNRTHIISRMDKLAAEGLRVLALSAKLAPIGQEAEIKAMPRDELEKGFMFVGLVGIYDPPRPASRSAVLECHKAGITPRMLTGDHPATAAAISRSVGIIDANSPASAVMTGQQFDALTEEQIDALPELPLVVARCAPETKVRMVEAIHRRRRYGMQCTTIMTGDGGASCASASGGGDNSDLSFCALPAVNDCPALKRADIGFAMGLNGSDVAKGAAEVVLADDQFGTITRAIKKGRGVLLNLSKFLLFLLSGNIAEVLVLRESLSRKPLGLQLNKLTTLPPPTVIGLAFQDSTVRRRSHSH